MFGTLRLVLALLVVISHIDFPGMKNDTFNYGIWAVVNFYLVSGFVMGMWFKQNPNTGATAFYKDRFFRIFPQYLFFFLITLLLRELLHLPSHILAGKATFLNVLMNLVIVPLNYQAVIEDIQHFQLIPPAWSLGAEIQFYLMAPFLYKRGGLRKGVFFASVIIFFLGTIGYLEPNWFALQFFPGVAFIFIIGMGLALSHKQLMEVVLHPIYLLLLALFVGLAISQLILLGHNREVCLALLLGIPLVQFLSRFSRKTWDDRLGRLTYGTFLCHQLVIWIARQSPLMTQVTYKLGVMGFCLALGYVGYRLIEVPFYRFRREQK